MKDETFVKKLERSMVEVSIARHKDLTAEDLECDNGDCFPIEEYEYDMYRRLAETMNGFISTSIAGGNGAWGCYFYFHPDAILHVNYHKRANDQAYWYSLEVEGEIVHRLEVVW